MVKSSCLLILPSLFWSTAPRNFLTSSSVTFVEVPMFLNESLMTHLTYWVSRVPLLSTSYFLKMASMASFSWSSDGFCAIENVLNNINELITWFKMELPDYIEIEETLTNKLYLICFIYFIYILYFNVF